MDYLVFIGLCDAMCAPSNDQYTKVSTESIFDSIRELVGSKSGEMLSRVGLIAKQLAIKKVNQDSFPFHYMRVVNLIVDALRGRDTSRRGEVSFEEWKAVIEIIYRHAEQLNVFEKRPQDYSDQDMEFAEAYVGLSSIGVEFGEKDGELFIKESSFALVGEIIDRYCRSLGGQGLLNWVFQTLGKGYDSKMGRFLLLTKISVNNEVKIADEAYGFLIALGAKYISIKGNSSIPGAAPKLAVLCRDLTITLEIQDYSIWQTIYFPVDRFMLGLQRIVWYDNIVDFKQVRLSHARIMLEGFSSHFVESGLRVMGVTVKNLIKVAVALIGLCEAKRPKLITLDVIVKKTRLPMHVVKQAVDSTLAFHPDALNVGLSFPLRSESVNYNFRPAVVLGSAYFVYPRSIAAAATINAVLNAIVYPEGKRIEENSRKLGVLAEELLRREFLRRGAKICYGIQYLGGEPEFESDLIVESEKAVIIFEVKKKDLTRKAMSGDHISLLSDLADSLVHSHAQASRISHELKLGRELCLEHEGVVRRISLNDRKIIKVSVSLNDFGAFQDKATLGRILDHACQLDMFHPKDSEDGRLKKWRQHIAALKKYTRADLNPERPPISIFFDSYFLSVPQILTILDDSLTVAEFEDTLSLIGVMLQGKKNFYREYPEIQRMQQYKIKKVKEFSSDVG